MAKKEVRQVSIFINGKEVENSLKGIGDAKRQVNNELRKLIVGTDEYNKKAKDFQELDALEKKHIQNLRGIKQGWDLTKLGVSNFVGIAAGAFAVDSIIGYGKQLFNTGVQMDALDKKAKTVFGATLPLVTAEAEKNARAMGLTNAEYIAAAANIQDLLVPMGFQRKEAADISTQLVNLSGALSEWSGGQRSATEVAATLNKALLGEREELKGLGISISEADVQAQLAAKGLDKLTGASLEQAKASATLELILAKSTDAQAAFANGSDSAIRRQAELSAKISEIVEKLATLLLPVFEKLADIAGVVVGAVGEVVGVIDDLVNPAEAATKAFDQQAATVSDLENNILPLLDRYDELTGKTTLNAAEQDELQKIITEVSGVIPTAISGFDAYGRALGLNTDKAREFIEVERARLKFINQEAIAENEKFIAETQRQADIVLEKLRSGRAAVTRQSSTGFGAVTEFENLSGSEIQRLQAEAAKLQETLKGANAEVSRLKGDNLNNPAITPPEVPTPGGGASAGDKDKALKEAQKLQDNLTALIERTAEIRRDLLAKQTNDEIEIAIRGVEKRYDAEIEKALELEQKGVTEATAQRIALEQLKQDEITVVIRQSAEKARAEQEKKDKENKEADLKKEMDYWAQVADERAKFLEDQASADAEIKEFNNEALLSERDLELLGVEEQYQKLLGHVEKYGGDKAALTEAYRKRIQEINDKYDKEQKEKDDLTLKERMEALEKAFVGFGNLAMATYDLLGKEGEKGAEFQKIATLAKIAFDTAAAITSLMAASEGNPLNLLTSGAAGIAQFAAGLARILTTAAQAKKILSGAPKVQQKAKGRYLTVTGDDDGRTYNAAVIPAPYTGLLPPHPVLFQSQATGQPVLASERGQEYFVSSEALRNPYVANLTRMIDNIAHTGGRGVAQFADGGANPPLDGRRLENGGNTNGEMMRLIEQNTAAMQSLLTAVQRGIIAVVPDGTVLDINTRFKKINDASGGYYG